MACPIIFVGCGQLINNNDSIQRQSCKARGLTLVYEGATINKQVFPKSIYLEDQKGQKTVFLPQDGASVQQSSFIIYPAWSPNDEWLLLPEGRFDGFGAFKASELPDSVGKKAMRVCVCGPTGTRWWHEFTGWKSSSVFEFRAGLSGQFTKFECDLSSGKITVSDGHKIKFLLLPIK